MFKSDLKDNEFVQSMIDNTVSRLIGSRQSPRASRSQLFEGGDKFVPQVEVPQKKGGSECGGDFQLYGISTESGPKFDFVVKNNSADYIFDAIQTHHKQ